MGWTLTSIVARSAVALGMRPQWSTPYAAAHAAGRAQRGHRPDGDNVFERAYTRTLARTQTADAKALVTALGAVGDDAQVIYRAVSTGAPVAAVAALAAAWERLPKFARDGIRAPMGTEMGTVRWGTATASQVDQTTCGAAVMAMMLMTGDPFVAAWVMTGRHFGGYLPKEVLDVTLLIPGTRSIAERWHALQRVIHRETARRGLFGAPWPRALGTPPWRVDDQTRYAGLAFRGVILDDSDPGAVTAAIAHASAALRDGIPVPMYTSGDSRLGLATVIPRHVVLMVGRTDHGFLVYEPGAGAVVPLAEARMFGGGPREAAYGHWTRAAWLILPRPR